MLKYILFALLLFLVACAPVVEEAAVEKPVFGPATASEPLLIQKEIEVPVGGSAEMEGSFFNDGLATRVGFREGLFAKDTITCFTVEGLTVNMVLRMPAEAVAQGAAVPLQITVEDASRSPRGRSFDCTMQLFTAEGEIFQKEFSVVLI